MAILPFLKKLGRLIASPPLLISPRWEWFWKVALALSVVGAIFAAYMIGLMLSALDWRPKAIDLTSQVVFRLTLIFGFFAYLSFVLGRVFFTERRRLLLLGFAALVIAASAWGVYEGSTPERYYGWD